MRKKEIEVEQDEFAIGRTELGELARLTGYKMKMRQPAMMKLLRAFLRTVANELEKGNTVILPNVGTLQIKIKEPTFVQDGILKNTDGDIYTHYRYKLLFKKSISLKERLHRASIKRFGKC